ncbi:MAG: Flp pilus assembly protein CpaB [Tabrizicola sp.]|nr:Flp pilus assembly protein CpaB [Tabrizicola sp.]
MRAVFGLVLIAGLALAGFAVYMAQDFLGATQSALDRERAFNAKVGKLVEVYVVNKAMKYGDPLTPADVQLSYWPEKTLPTNAFLDEATLFPADAKGPRYIMRSVEPFEPLLSSRVTNPGEVAGLIGKLEPGKRAFAITVGVGTGVSGFVQPDDYIDIYWTGSVRGVEGEITRLIESSMRIIAVDNATSEGQNLGNTSARTITISGTPEQVARLAQAQRTGGLSMSLVGDPGSIVESGPIEVDTKTLLNIEEKVVEEVEAKKVCTVKNRKGSEEVEIEIPCPD